MQSSPVRNNDQAAYRRQYLKADRIRRLSDTGAEIEKGDKPHKPSHEDLRVLTREREDLYRAREPPGDPIPIVLPDPFALTNGPPSSWLPFAVQRLLRSTSPGPSSIRSGNLKV